MLGLLLARTGVEVMVLEKHGDFLRDFRGDTLHPSTLELMDELGFLDDLLALPHQELDKVQAVSGERVLSIADFAHLPTRCKFIAFMPQWDFLNFLVEKASAYPTFGLRMNCEVTQLIGPRIGPIEGVRATGPDGELEVRGDLVVACDGRHSRLRDMAGLRVKSLGAPMDVMWFRLSRHKGDPDQAIFRFDAGRLLVMINRGEHWQCGYVIPKGGADASREAGLNAFRRDVAEIAPAFADRIGEITAWEQVSVLSVRVDRLQRWFKDGLLCLGDAAHAMSPVGGIGINLAIQDAVAAANLLAEPIRQHQVTLAHLGRLQRRRELATRVTQRVQVVIQNRVLKPVLQGSTRRPVPPLLRLVDSISPLQRILADFVGLGVRPEHIHRRASSRP